MNFKICSVGCGRHAHMVHGPSLMKYASLHADVKLAACCDLSEESASSFSRKFGYSRIYTDLDQMLIHEKPDVISLVMPEHLTASVASKILRAGVPLILEKPPGLRKEEVTELALLAEKNKVPNRVAFNRRYTPLVRRLRSLIHDNPEQTGMEDIEYYMSRVDRRDPDFSTTAIHAIDAVRFITDSDYDILHFNYQELPEIGTGVANIIMHGSMISGVTLSINIFPVSGVLLERTRIHSRNMTLFLDLPMFAGYDAPGKLSLFKENRLVLEESGQTVSDGEEMFESSGFYYENASFFDALKMGESVTGGLDSAIQSVEIAQCIRERQPFFSKS